MSKINIGSVGNGNNVFGDHNTITNNIASTAKNEKVLVRDEYFQMILEIRDLERISVEHYLEDKFQKFAFKNPDFIKILYKDICQVLDGVDDKDDNDVYINKGDFEVEYGDVKLTGNPTSLHFALIWSYIKLVEEFQKDASANLWEKMECFENDFLNVNYYTATYRKKILGLNSELKKDKYLKETSDWNWKDLNDFIDFKPNIAGIGINFNAIFAKLINRKKKEVIIINSRKGSCIVLQF